MVFPRSDLRSKKTGSKFIVSACLAGADCTYQGKSKFNKIVAEMVAGGEAMAFCPEVAGGLAVPRDRAEIIGGDGHDVLRLRARVVSCHGKDLTANYIKGAKKLMAEATRRGIKMAVLKSNSPACGAGVIFDGTFTRRTKHGDGVLAAACIENGIKVFTEKSFKPLKTIDQRW